MASAAKRADRETTEGVVLTRLEGVRAAIVAVGCETEPVSKNEEFRAFADGRARRRLRRASRSRAATSSRSAAASSAAGSARTSRSSARGDMHAGEGRDARRLRAPARAQDRCAPARAAAARPSSPASSPCTSPSRGRPTPARDEVPAELVAGEREILEKLPEVESKPAEVREKIVEGMLNKRFFAESVLSEQAWIHDTGLSVAAALSQGGLELARLRLVLGGLMASAAPHRAAGAQTRFQPRGAQALRGGADGPGRLRPRRRDGRRARGRARRGARRCRARARDRRWQRLPWHEGGGGRHGPRDGRLHGHARHRLQLAGGAGGARAQRRRHARPLRARRARGRRALHPSPRHPPPREGPHRHLRGRHRQPLLLDRHRGGAAGARDRRGRDPDGQERRARCLRRRPACPTRRRLPAPAHAPAGDRARPQGHGHDGALALHGQQPADPRLRAHAPATSAACSRGESAGTLISTPSEGGTR